LPVLKRNIYMFIHHHWKKHVSFWMRNSQTLKTKFFHIS
jgi:hypothetical protein